ncbi:hypothetical protein [Paraburkholderia guartelaensis]|uniref:hypothetical protein n=1 Tax=Paraburkholderia guartelaensis TaxID=2546446 RepID=UPI002AB6AF8C|nr:hypothetical protein [Paraburkholderia guartelaensis]
MSAQRKLRATKKRRKRRFTTQVLPSGHPVLPTNAGSDGEEPFEVHGRNTELIGIAKFIGAII